MLSPSVFNTAATTWTCSVTDAGTTTSTITTSCGAASGTGNINQVVTLTQGAEITFNVNAAVLNTFNGTATNTVTIDLPDNVTDTTPANQTGTAPNTTVTAATLLTVSKTNNSNTVVAGSTTTYTITVANAGFADADGAALRDPDVNGLSCTQIACTGGCWQWRDLPGRWLGNGGQPAEHVAHWRHRDFRLPLWKHPDLHPDLRGGCRRPALKSRSRKPRVGRHVTSDIKSSAGNNSAIRLCC